MKKSNQANQILEEDISILGTIRDHWLAGVLGSLVMGVLFFYSTVYSLPWQMPLLSSSTTTTSPMIPLTHMDLNLDPTYTDAHIQDLANYLRHAGFIVHVHASCSCFMLRCCCCCFLMV